MKQPKKAKTTLFLTPPAENRVPKSKMFFFSVQTRRLHESFEGSYSLLASFSAQLSRATVDANGRLMHFMQFSDFGDKMGFLGHNFGSRHARRSSMGSINAGDPLFFKNSLRQNFGPWDWRPGPVKIGQKNESAPTLRSSPRRTPHPNKKIFFLIEPGSVPASVEGLNTSLAAATGELYPKNREPT